MSGPGPEMGSQTGSQMSSQVGSAMSGVMQRLSTAELLIGAGALLVLLVDVVGWVVLGSTGPGSATEALTMAAVVLIYLRRWRGMGMDGGAISYDFLLLFIGLTAGLFGLDNLRGMVGSSLSGTETIFELLEIIGKLVMGAGGVFLLWGGMRRT